MPLFPFLAGAAGLALASLLAWLGGRLARDHRLFPSFPRKLFHVGIFTGAGPIYLLTGFWGTVAYGAGISVLVLAALQRGRDAALFRVLARTAEGEEGRRYVFLPLVSTALGGLAGTLLVGPYAVVGFLVCGWGDSVGEPVGARWGAHRYSVLISGRSGRTRSVEGSLAVFVAGSLGAWAALALVGHGMASAALVGLLCGLAGAVAEGLSSHGTDNLLTQLLPSLAAWWVLG